MNRAFLRISVVLAMLPLQSPSRVIAQEVAAPWVTRFTAKHIFNEGVGHDRGFTTLEWFLPLNQDAENEMYFGDFRGIMFDDAEFGGNLGMGFRQYHSGHDRIYGVNAYWDFRDESSLLFNQAGIGVESLGQIVDFRVNGYTPTVNDANQRLPFATFTGNNLLYNEILALTGVDYEAAVNLPDIGPFQSRIAAGGYYFDSSRTEAANGWRARLELAFRDALAASVTVQDDDMFGQTVNVTVEIRELIEHTDALSRRAMYHKFRNEDGRGDGRTVRHRLADPVYRQQNIVLQNTQSLVRDTSGTPFTFIHVVEGGAGDGTFEMPFGTMAMAMADPLAPTSVVYTPEGGTFTEDVSLVAGTRLLSNGPVQTVPGTSGPVRLPFSGVSADLTALPASIVGDVELASNTEFSGFDVTGGINGTGITTASVNQTAINSAPGVALTLTASDSVTVDTIAINMPTGSGVLLDDTEAILSNIAIASAGDAGIQIDNGATDRLVTITNATITDAANEGIDVNVAGAGNLTLVLTASAISSTGNTVDVTTTGAGDALVTADNLTLESTTGTGFNADGSGGAGTLFINSFSGNAVTNAMTGGVMFNTVTFDSDPGDAGNQSVSSGTLSIGTSGTRVAGDGLSLMDGTGDWNTGVLSIFNETGTGLLADNSVLGTPMMLSSEAGSVVDTETGPAIELNTITSSLTFDSITSTDSLSRGIGITSSTGSLTSGMTTLTDSVLASIRYEAIALPDMFSADFGNTIINSTISAVEADNIEKVGVTDGLTENYTPLTINFP